MSDCDPPLQAPPTGQPIAEVLESISDAFFALDRQWRFTYLNGAAERLLSCRRADLLGKLIWDEFPEAVGSPFDREYHRAVDTGLTVEFEAYYPPLSTWFEVRAYPTPNGLSVYFQDHGERRQMREGLRYSEQRYRSLVTATSSIVWTTDGAGAIVAENPSWQAFTGQAPEQYRGWGWLDAVHPDDRAPTADVWKTALASKALYETEYRIRRHDGLYRHVLARGVPVLDPDGALREWIGTCADVTEGRRAEQELRRNESLLRGMALSAPLGLYVVDDRNGAILFHNRRFRELWGLTHLEGPLQRGELTDRDLLPDRLRRVADVAAFVASSGPLQDPESRAELIDEVEFRDGRIIRRFSTPIRDGADRYFARLSIFEDVTEQRRGEVALRAAKEEAERASRAKDEFIAVLSHELRTPLTPVLLTTSLIESHPDLPDDLRDDVAAIRRNVELESRLIGDLLDMTRITRGTMQLDVEEVDVHLLLRMAIDICQREDAVRLVVDLAAHRHHVRGDSSRLQQVFWNLINNAQKFTDDRGTITVRTSDVPGDRVRIAVVDDGAGIDPEVLPRLFSAFEQGDVRDTRAFAGLGLGLAISRKLVEAHGGTIAASSAGKGAGATFTVELPTIPVFGPRPVARPMERREEGDRPLRVLLVEDHEVTLKTLARLLTRHGYRISTASSVASALAMAGQERFDVVISDLGLPDGSGLDLMRKLRDRYARRSIALTGYGMAEDIRRSREAGFAEHITKPVDLDVLEEAIRRVTATTDGG